MVQYSFGMGSLYIGWGKTMVKTRTEGEEEKVRTELCELNKEQLWLSEMSKITRGSLLSASPSPPGPVLQGKWVWERWIKMRRVTELQDVYCFQVHGILGCYQYSHTPQIKTDILFFIFCFELYRP